MLPKAICILLFIGFAAPETSISSVVSRILDLARETKNRSPVILVVNSRALESSVEVNHQSSEEQERSLLQFLTKINKPRTFSQKRYRGHPEHDDNTYKYVRSRPKTSDKVPIYKSLLSLRNSLRCGARDECKDECSETFVGSKKNKCKQTCEVEFECDEEPSGCNDDDGCDVVSTKGPPASDEKPFGCTRC